MRLAQPGKGAGEGPGGKLDACLAVGAKASDLVKDRRDGHRHEPVAGGIEIPFLDGHEIARAAVGPRANQVIQARFGQHPPDVIGDRRPIRRVGWHPVHDDRQGQPALQDTGQHGPGHLVGVPCRSRHEDAQVGGLDEPIGQRAVRMLDGVDIRRIDEGQPGIDRRVIDIADLTRGNAGQGALRDGVMVVGMDEDDCHPCGRP